MVLEVTGLVPKVIPSVALPYGMVMMVAAFMLPHNGQIHPLMMMLTY
jgi:hypothetical protein